MSRHALPYLAAARVDGADAAAFLHAQLSAEVAGLAPGASTFACYLSPRGQVLGLLLVGRRADDYVLIASAELLPGLLRRLGLYVLRAKVAFSPLPSRVVGIDDADCNGRDARWNPGLGLVYGIAEEGPESDDSHVEAWKAMELGHGVAWLDARTSERFIPQMLGFDRIGAVSFKKGCYPGQEIVARARYLGNVKRGPLYLALQGDEAPQALRGAWPETGSGLSLIAGEELADATLIDLAVAADGRIRMRVVAPLVEWVPREVELGGRRYGCATI